MARAAITNEKNISMLVVFVGKFSMKTFQVAVLLLSNRRKSCYAEQNGEWGEYYNGRRQTAHAIRFIQTPTSLDTQWTFR